MLQKIGFLSVQYYNRIYFIFHRSVTSHLAEQNTTSADPTSPAITLAPAQEERWLIIKLFWALLIDTLPPSDLHQISLSLFAVFMTIF